MTNLDLKQDHYRELIRNALNTRAGWIPAGPVDAARHKRLRSYDRANVVSDLERAGLLALTLKEKRNKQGFVILSTYTIRLTDAGRDAILAMPDDIGAELYPLPVDIRAAKEKLSK